MTEHDKQLAAWKAKHGLDRDHDHSEEEIRMIAEEQISKGRSWCLRCDKHMPIKEMKLITRMIDAYVQMDDGPGYYIKPSLRVRMCPECFKETYEQTDP